jgi:hypothetical protein
MKELGRYSIKILLSAGALLTACAVSAGVSTATVQAVQAGAAEYSKAGGTWKALQAGTVLEEGSTVKTDSAGVVDLYLGANGPLLRISPDSVVELAVLRQIESPGELITSTKIKVRQGKVGGMVRKLSRASQFLVVTDRGTFSVSGSKFVGTAEGQFTVQEGEATLLYAAAGQGAPAKYAMKSGQTFQPQARAGKGDVLATPADLAAEVALYMDGMEIPEWNDIAERWVAAPSWLAMPRPFDDPQGKNNPPWILPMIEPTTAVDVED